MSLYRYVNSSPSLSVPPSMSPDHHPRTSLMAAKASSGVWSTVKVLVKLLSFMIFSTFSRTRPLCEPTGLAGAALVPVVDLDIVWLGRTFPGFEKRLQAHQKDPPLGAAMVHELHRLLPTLVFEEDDG